MYFAPPALVAEPTPKLVLWRQADRSITCRLEAGTDLVHAADFAPRSLRSNIETAGEMLIAATLRFLPNDEEDPLRRIRDGMLLILGAVYLAEVRGQSVTLAYGQYAIRSVQLNPDMTGWSRDAVTSAVLAVCLRKFCNPAGKVRRITNFDWCRIGFELVAHVRLLEAADDMVECARRAIGLGSEHIGVGPAIEDMRR